MSKVTSKLQITLPRAIADQYDIKPGDEISWQHAGGVIRLTPKRMLAKKPKLSVEDKLAILDASLKRARQIQKDQGVKPVASEERGWTREDLYDDRGLPRRH